MNSNERILINMKPDGAKWSGRIHDPDSGRNYNFMIAMKDPNAMRVQGCAFGGMFCGGQDLEARQLTSTMSSSTGAQ